MTEESNVALVERAVALARDVGREVATGAAARQALMSGGLAPMGSAS